MIRSWHGQAGRLSMQEVVRVGVTVTFLRMDAAPREAAPSFPDGVEVQLVQDCTVEFYRYLYNTVGNPHVWWLRRTMPDHQLAGLLRDPRITIHALYADGQPAGFYELDSTAWPTVNLGYFGLMPQAVGRGFGYAFLRHAVDTAWRAGPRVLTVNTCTADHPRALPTYKRAGFRVAREVREEWNVPTSLGLPIPESLLL
jgi:GNAT superfamily N-acetyltransferase